MTSDPIAVSTCLTITTPCLGSSGFTGENSTLVVNQHGSALWCDGRFYVQADKQLAGTEISACTLVLPVSPYGGRLPDRQLCGR